MRSTQVTAHPIACAAHLTRPARPERVWRLLAVTLIATLGFAVGASPLKAHAQTFTVLYRFAGYPTDGGKPEAGLFIDAAGNLYGTTAYGGNNESCPGSGIGCGTAFKVDTNGVEAVLHNFTGADGANPIASPMMDAKGDLYGTTRFGGRLEYCTDGGFAGCGVVFKLSGSQETVLYRFCSIGNCDDGIEPWGGVVMDASGVLYGTTNLGGKFGGGVAFKLAGKKETVLHSFTGGTDGDYLTAGLLMDAKGNLYGTAAFGGDLNCNYPNGCGVVFKLAGKKETVLHAFKGSPDGDTPYGGLLMDPNGNIYGTTVYGGASDSGTVFKVSRQDKERVWYAFHAQQGGGGTQSGLVRDAEGNLYGTSPAGGDAGYGVVFEITRYGKEKVLHNFCTGDCSDGAYPSGDLIMDAKGNLYGTAYGGGVNGNGTIFMITP
jgi:uncharacterized repeat protein (TIGR03803 family)